MNATEQYIHAISSYYIENLPETLLASFVPQKRIALSTDMMYAFAARLGIPGIRNSIALNTLLASLSASIKDCLRDVEGGNFIRLGSRSPKDTAYDKIFFRNVAEAYFILMFSKRVFQDVQWAVLYEYPVSLFVRPRLDIRKWQEFRCIVKDKKLFGISQYYTHDNQYFDEIHADYKNIASSIKTFLQNNVVPNSEHENYICDIWHQSGENAIVDYNPLLATTGLCFFEKSFPEPEAPEFRFRIADGKVARVILTI